MTPALARPTPTRPRRRIPQAAVCLAALVSGCASGPPPQAPGRNPKLQPLPLTTTSTLPGSDQGSNPSAPSLANSAVRSVILPGTDAYPSVAAPSSQALGSGSISLNFPSVDVQMAAKSVLGDILGLSFAVDPSVHGVISLVTPHPVSEADVLVLMEDALKASSLALVQRSGVYTVVPLDQARNGASVIGPDQTGFGTETITLRYANPVELKKLLDPIVPGVITTTDTGTGAMVLSGTTGQRRSVRELVQQFDIDWLKGMSFALFVPKNTDARLIAPELDKLINAPGSTTAGLVRLVTMERLNGIVAIASRAAFLDDVRRWVEVLDKEGEASERKLYIYRVQNGRAADLADVLISALGGGGAGAGGRKSSSNGGGLGQTGAAGGGGAALGGQGANGGQMTSAQSLGTGGATPTLGSLGAPGGQGTTLPGQSPTSASGAVKVGASADSLIVTSDETNNAVVAYATPREYALIEDALRKLDIPPLQVVIEAAISEVTLNDSLQYGTQWFFQTHGAQYGLSQGTTSAATSAFPGFGYTIVGANGISATINALSAVTHVEILSAPNLMVLNNQTASLEVGDEVPISTGSAVSTLTANAPVVNAITYQDTGIILKVTPRVNASGLVLLDISQEVSQVTPTTAATNPLNSPVISERKIATSVAVQDGQTIALGGLISDNNSKGRSGVPLLSAIPIIGALAGSVNDSRTRTEILVLLTPKVIRTADDAQAITLELKQKIRAVQPIWPKIEP